jgi:hypothetical protein
MERLHFMTYKGKIILIEDFSDMKPGEVFMQALDEAGKMIRSQPEHSVLAVFDATNSHFNNEILEAMKAFTQANTPYIKAATVVGITGLLKIALKSISKFSGREFHLFDTREEAMEWLIQQ